VRLSGIAVVFFGGPDQPSDVLRHNTRARSADDRDVEQPSISVREVVQLDLGTSPRSPTANAAHTPSPRVLKQPALVRPDHGTQHLVMGGQRRIASASACHRRVEPSAFVLKRHYTLRRRAFFTTTRPQVPQAGDLSTPCYGIDDLSMPRVGELVRCTDGRWMIRRRSRAHAATGLPWSVTGCVPAAGIPPGRVTLAWRSTHRR
jgi:hypothetical protein